MISISISYWYHYIPYWLFPIGYSLLVIPYCLLPTRSPDIALAIVPSWAEGRGDGNLTVGEIQVMARKLIEREFEEGKQ